MGSKVPIRTNFGPHWLSFYAVETSFKISYIRKSYRFGKTWRWANDDRIGISGWIDLVLSLNKTCPLVWKTQNKNRKLLQWCYMGKILHTENHCSNIFNALVELGCLASNNKAYLHALTNARYVDVALTGWNRVALSWVCVCVCVRVCCGWCVYVWLCWDSWGIKRSIYPETNSAFLLVSGESDQTPGLIPYSAVPSLSKPAFTHKSLADPFLPKRLLIFRCSTAQLATPCYSLEFVCGVLFDSIGAVLLLFWTGCLLLGCLRRRPAARPRCRVFQSTVGHARRPLPQLALSVIPNNVSSLLRMCHPPNHHIGLHNKHESWAPRSKQSQSLPLLCQGEEQPDNRPKNTINKSGRNFRLETKITCILNEK